jgi:hypothetical protein
MVNRCIIRRGGRYRIPDGEPLQGRSSMKTLAGALLAALLGLAPASAQDKKPVPAHAKVDQQKVDDAILKGCRFLIGAGNGFGTFPHGKRNQPEAMQSYSEIVLLTLLHSGYYNEQSPELQGLIQYVSTKQIGSTYTASLMAMALQKLNPRKYQPKIAECAQFLCDNQAQNGQWDYGEPEPPPDPDKANVPTGGAGKKRDDVASGGGSGTGSNPSATAGPPKSGKGAGKTEALPKIPVRKKKPGPPNGDNSNSQYAALGLRACLDAGIDVDPRVLHGARQWWLKCQNSDGGWGYNGEGSQGGDDNPTSVSNTSYGSMTVGAVGALCIFDYYMGMQYKTNGSVVKGLDWLAKNYDVTKNPMKTSFAYLYYLYGLERVGMLYGTEKIGNNEWYPDGANHLLTTQKPGGYWDPGDRFPSGANLQTCFAILFLRRGTAPLRPVATGGGAGPAMGQGVANAPAGGNIDPGLAGRQKSLNQVAPGWRLLNNLVVPGFDKLQEVRGKSDVFTTVPPNLATHPTFRKEVSVGAGQKTTLRLVIGHHESGSWTLVVRVDGKDILSKEVSSRTSKDGWLEVSVDLSPYGGKTFICELVNVPGGTGTEVGYWAEVALRDP